MSYRIKICYGCSRRLRFIDFHKDRSRRDGHANLCKCCARSYKHVNLARNTARSRLRRSKLCPEFLRDRNRCYMVKWLSNPENLQHVKDYRRQWRINNKEWLNKYLNTYWSEPIHKIRKNIVSRVRIAVKKQHFTASVTELVGCSYQQLKLYLEPMFRDGMSWNNYGKIWHIDHIRPIVSFDFKDIEQVRKCINYTNLQPLLVLENLKKGAKLII